MSGNNASRNGGNEGNYTRESDERRGGRHSLRNRNLVSRPDLQGLMNNDDDVRSRSSVSSTSTNTASEIGSLLAQIERRFSSISVSSMDSNQHSPRIVVAERRDPNDYVYYDLNVLDDGDEPVFDDPEPVAGPSNARERQSHAERVRQYRESQSQVFQAARLARDRARRAERVSQETEEQRQMRLEVARRQLSINRRSGRRPAAANLPPLLNLGMGYDPDIPYESYPTISIGSMDKICSFCQARTFRGESAGFCCAAGKVRLESYPHPPSSVRYLFDGDSPISKQFLKNIRNYNNCFRMTSFGASGGIVNEGNFMPTFKVHGQVYHRIGGLLANPSMQPQFLQIYFVGDDDCELDVRCSISRDVNRNVLAEFQRVLHEHNRLIRLFKTNLENMPRDDQRLVIRSDRPVVNIHPGRLNAPTANEVAIVMIDGETSHRDIIIQRRDQGIKRIVETHPSYDALGYPLILWQGIDTYHFNIKRVNPTTLQPLAKKVTSLDFYCYQLQVRTNEHNFLLKCQTLLNQYVVDMFAKIEGERLLYIKTNQSRLRADDYIHLRDAFLNDGDVENLGRQVILPSTFTGSPRHMHEYSQDAMAYVRLYGRPDFFITFTCNPTWDEIKINLFQNQSAPDRHDVVSRVFRRKLIAMMDTMIKDKLFGQVRCFMYSIEWQKRGLPHAHILIWLYDKLRPEQIDQVICAEIPDIDEDPLLHSIVTKHMVHGPCGAINMRSTCMIDGRCSKRFPKQFVSETRSDLDGYPLYRRRRPEDGGNTFTPRDNLEIDNRWIVPYNPVLLRMFNAHINVEYCHSVKSIKYICKYINKGGDMASIELRQAVGAHDEVSQYQLGRYISSSEAFWRIFSFPIHDKHPAVVQLEVHLENGQRVIWRPGDAQRIVEHPPNTTLTAFFDLCRRDMFASTLLYSEVPTYFTWNKSTKVWQKRVRGRLVPDSEDIYDERYYAEDTIGRIYGVHPNHSECFYLRILLTRVRGPFSFAELKTVNGTVCETFRESCQLRGFLESDEQWDNALTECGRSHFSSSIMELFCIIICHCGPSNPLALWEKHKEAMSESYLMRLRSRNPDATYCDTVFNHTLCKLEDMCMAMVGKLLSELGLPTPSRNHRDLLNSEILQETSYNSAELERIVVRDLHRLLPDQKLAFDTIVDAVERRRPSIFFIDAPGGTGKTFVINLILAYLRQKEHIVLATASSGIAATLLQGGRTAHSTFKLPLTLHRTEQPVCNITVGSAKGRLMQQCSAIVWDECTMAHKKALEALDRMFKDVRRNDSIMGGVVVILAGDFRQTLPVIPKGTPADILDACLKKSHLWRHVQKLPLRTNMRVQLSADLNAANFARKLLQLGNGVFPSELPIPYIPLNPDFCQVVETESELIERVFPDIQLNYRDLDWLSKRALLSSTNDRVDALNLTIQDRIRDPQARHYFSVDTVCNPEEAIHFPSEFLNSLKPPGIPPHELILKRGSPIMLLRNLKPPMLCNGTRLVVKTMMNNSIQARIICGPYKGEEVYIPRIPLIPTDMFFEFKRVQFPIKLSFCMTINKSQGQTMDIVGIDLRQPCFSHGQLYVGCSRVGSASKMYILAPQRKTQNIVFPSALI